MTGSTLKCHKALGFDCIALTHLYFSVALNMYIFSLYTFVASFGFKKSNWQNSHRFLLKTLRPLYHNEPFYKKNGYNLTTLPIGQKSLLEDLLASEMFIVCYVICLYSHTVHISGANN